MFSVSENKRITLFAVTGLLFGLSAVYLAAKQAESQRPADFDSCCSLVPASFLKE